MILKKGSYLSLLIGLSVAIGCGQGNLSTSNALARQAEAVEDEAKGLNEQAFSLYGALRTKLFPPPTGRATDEEINQAKTRFDACVTAYNSAAGLFEKIGLDPNVQIDLKNLVIAKGRSSLSKKNLCGLYKAQTEAYAVLSLSPTRPEIEVLDKTLKDLAGKVAAEEQNSTMLQNQIKSLNDALQAYLLKEKKQFNDVLGTNKQNYIDASTFETGGDQESTIGVARYNVVASRTQIIVFGKPSDAELDAAKAKYEACKTKAAEASDLFGQAAGPGIQPELAKYWQLRSEAVGYFSEFCGYSGEQVDAIRALSSLPAQTELDALNKKMNEIGDKIQKASDAQKQKREEANKLAASRPNIFKPL